MSRFFTLLSVVLASGCMHHARVGYLEAAQIDVDSDIQTVLVIDRSRPRNVGEHMLGGAEGAVTGETFRLDAESAALAIETLEDMLEDAPRFEVVQFHVNGRAVDSSMWDRQMTASKVRQLCRQASCDAVIALETFDSDVHTALEVEVDRYSPQERAAAQANGTCEDRRCAGDADFTAHQSTDVTAKFRMYDGDTGQVIDVVHTDFVDTDTGRDGDSADEAMDRLPLQARVFDGATAIGVDYARRISPTQVVASRRIFGSGSKEMRTARKLMKSGDLEGAETLYRAIVQRNDKLEAKALHNLAVAAEARGDLQAATKYANRAIRNGAKRATSQYVATLRDRAANDARVAGQLGTVVAKN